MAAEQAGDAGKAGGEDEGLDAGAGILQRVRKVEQQACVALHRSADVAEQNQRPWPKRRALPAEDQQLTAKSQAAPQQPAHVELVAAASPCAPRSRQARWQPHQPDQSSYLGHLNLGQRVEVFRAEDLRLRVAAPLLLLRL